MKFKITIPKRNTDNKTRHYFYIKYGNSKYGLSRLRGTFNWQVIRENYYKHYIFQFSFKDPWWKPKVDFINNDSWRLYGWLFFYVGWSLNKQDDEGEWYPVTKETYENRITIKDHYRRYDRTCLILSTIIELLLFIPPCYILFSHNYDAVTTIWLSMVIAVVSNMYISRLIRED
jgi:hypothetical protein